MPGCPLKEPAERALPRIRFFPNRQFHYTANTNPQFKAAFAYMFSLLPEAVDVALQTLKNTRGVLEDTVDITVEGISYSKLVSDSGLLDRFKGVMKRATAEAAGNGVTAADVSLKIGTLPSVARRLSPMVGLKVRAAISQPEGASESKLRTTLEAAVTTPSFKAKLMEELKAIPGLVNAAADINAVKVVDV